MGYTNEEKRDMLRIYYINNRNSKVASEMYLHEYPERQHPHYTYFCQLERNLSEYGSFEKPRKKYGNRISEEDTNQVLEEVCFFNLFFYL